MIDCDYGLLPADLSENKVADRHGVYAIGQLPVERRRPSTKHTHICSYPSIPSKLILPPAAQALFTPASVTMFKTERPFGLYREELTQFDPKARGKPHFGVSVEL